MRAKIWTYQRQQPQPVATSTPTSLCSTSTEATTTTSCNLWWFKHGSNDENDGWHDEGTNQWLETDDGSNQSKLAEPDWTNGKWVKSDEVSTRQHFFSLK